ncbi:DoxX family protein [Halorarius halobius]|uniref:DoxX family protein n=1 Tax=Halorarius halobius TaxID=2962671 RepID=UPI0020CF41F3|nr:DoxX family membrane protein [Halorarius halobius]
MIPSDLTTVVLQSTPFGSAGAAEVFLLARVLFGGVLAFMGLNHFTNLDEMTGYAEFKGLPAPRLSVAFSGGLLVLGGLGLVVGAFQVLAAGALAVFLLVSAVTMHDFWSVDDPEEQQNEMTAFLKNAFGAGAALGFLALGGVAWPYALGIGAF